jgi:pimeloyl-ACP methyl ester carboxylesterase
MARKLLIIRGFNSKREHWQKVKEIIEKNNIEVLMPDLPGISYNFDSSQVLKVEDYEKIILEILKKANWEKFFLLSHSLGGAIALKFAVDFPKKIEKLIFCAPAIVGTKSPKKIIFYALGQFFLLLFSLPFLKNYWPQFKEKLLSFGLKDYYFEKGTRKKILKNFAKTNYKKLFGKIKNETLILWGKKDKDIPFKLSKKLKKYIKNSKIIIFDNCAHNPHKEIPQEFAKEVIKFIM